MTTPPRETDDAERQRIQKERWNLPEIVEYRELVFDTILKAWEMHPSPVLQEDDHRHVLALMRGDMDSMAQLVRHEALARGKFMCGIKTIIWLVGDQFWRQIVDEDSQIPIEMPKNIQPYDVKYRQMYLRAEYEGSAELEKLETEFERMKATIPQELSGAPTMAPLPEQAQEQTAENSEKEAVTSNELERKTEAVKNSDTFLAKPEDLTWGWRAMLGEHKRIPWGGPFTIAVPRDKFDGPAGVIEQPKNLNKTVKLFAQERPIEHGDDFWIIGVTFSDADASNSLDADMYRDIMIAFDGMLWWGIRHVVYGGAGGLETLRTSVEERCLKFRDSYDQDRMAAWVLQHLDHYYRSVRINSGLEL